MCTRRSSGWKVLPGVNISSGGCLRYSRLRTPKVFASRHPPTCRRRGTTARQIGQMTENRGRLFVIGNGAAQPLDWEGDEQGNGRNTPVGQFHPWRNPGAPLQETNFAGYSAHRDRHLRFASLRPERAHRHIALLQHGESDAVTVAAVAPEPRPGRARLLVDLPLDPPPSPLRSPDPRAHPEISVNRGVYRVAQTLKRLTADRGYGVTGYTDLNGSDQAMNE